MGKLDNILENNILNLDNVAEPFAGMQTGFGRQKEIAQNINKRTLIAGKGIKLTQGATGIVIEADNISQTFSYTSSVKGYEAVIGEITEMLAQGHYKIEFNNGEEMTTDSFAYEVNNTILPFTGYLVGEKILCFPILMPTLRIGELTTEEQEQ